MIKPVGPRVLIRPDDPIKQVGMIQLPDKAQKEVTRGTVLALGDPDDDWEWPFAVGETVIYSQYSSHQIKEGDDLLLLMSLKDVLAVVREEVE